VLIKFDVNSSCLKQKSFQLKDKTANFGFGEMFREAVSYREQGYQFQSDSTNTNEKLYKFCCETFK